jgi:L-ascorbate metabolism protein UlaG (beta-lactamase superfamily)
LNIKFYAHACVRLEGNGTSFITDPYTPSVSQFEPVGETCDVVIMSSSTDRFHSDASQVPGSPRVLDAMTIGPAGIEVNGVEVRAFPNRENKVEAAADNAMYMLTLDGVRVLHMGDAGWTPAPEYVAEMAGQVDVLLALTGDLPTIPLDDLEEFIAAIRPQSCYSYALLSPARCPQNQTRCDRKHILAASDTICFHCLSAKRCFPLGDRRDETGAQART